MLSLAELSYGGEGVTMFGTWAKGTQGCPMFGRAIALVSRQAVAGKAFVQGLQPMVSRHFGYDGSGGDRKMIAIPFDEGSLRQGHLGKL
jgi:hypothetical protein